MAWVAVRECISALTICPHFISVLTCAPITITQCEPVLAELCLWKHLEPLVHIIVCDLVQSRFILYMCTD